MNESLYMPLKPVHRGACDPPHKQLWGIVKISKIDRTQTESVYLELDLTRTTQKIVDLDIGATTPKVASPRC